MKSFEKEIIGIFQFNIGFLLSINAMKLLNLLKITLNTQNHKKWPWSVKHRLTNWLVIGAFNVL